MTSYNAHALAMRVSCPITTATATRWAAEVVAADPAVAPCPPEPATKCGQLLSAGIAAWASLCPMSTLLATLVGATDNQALAGP
jgi:hypothetical protein